MKPEDQRRGSYSNRGGRKQESWRGWWWCWCQEGNEFDGSDEYGRRQIDRRGDMTGEGMVAVKDDAKVAYRVGWSNSGALKRD